jgi:L-asparaginase II
MESESIVPVLVEVTRGPLTECRHRGQIAVADAQGNLRGRLGEPGTPVCLRSLAKPFQALPLITTGAAAAFGFGEAELALFSGSLSGQDFHVDLVNKILDRIGLDAAALQCGAHAPLHRPTAQALAKAGEKPTALHHTCAGKHAGMLALCVHHGWPVKGYFELQHPVQQLVLKTLAEVADRRPEDIPVAEDGCGVPTFYLPVRNIALSFARLAAAAPGSAEAQVLAATLAHPRLIAGDGRLETVLMETLPGRLFAKTGAEGGFALALVREKLGVALKVEDGASRALGPAILQVLAELGLLTPEAAEALKTYRQSVILNHRKQEVGEIRAAFTLAP